MTKPIAPIQQGETGSSRLCRSLMRDRSRILWTCSPRSGALLSFRELTPAFSDRSVSMDLPTDTSLSTLANLSVQGLHRIE
jgi:hypothetical protein